MPFAPNLRWSLSFVALCLFSTFAIAQNQTFDDEGSPEVTAKVARISFIGGDVRIKRQNEPDWESASLNLPLVEGDQISTSEAARVEIQFDSQKFLRLAENSSLKIATLRDEGIAVTMPQGILSLRVFEFEKESGFIEIDAPQTTVSVQKAGLYRIDAAGNSNQVRVTITQEGEARIYSDNAGFTLRNGRSATIFLSDDRLGEWQTAESPRYSDEWDAWVAERDRKLSELLNNAYYDQYYDRDIYGAEELNDYGSWSDSDEYGKVWRPHYSAISSYSNWSPYRYGNWRWVNPFGWVWVNDEPWGWATYHHGRWIYDHRGWFWTPYPYHRPKRSHWRPALVAIFNINNDICWYPLSYRDRYRSYNRGDNNWNKQNYNRPDFRRLPENSIVGVRSDEFGRRRHNTRSISLQTARQTFENNSNQTAQLPKFEERRQEFRRDSGFRRLNQANQIRTGVTERQAGVELDRRLNIERFRNNRQNERLERQNQPNNSTYRQSPTVTNQPLTRTESDSHRRTSERSRNDSNRPVYTPPPNNNSTENYERSRNRERNSDENRVIVRVPENNSIPNNQRSSERSNNSNESNRNFPRRERGTDHNNQNNVRRQTPPENRPVYVPRNNDDNRRSAPPRSENPQPQPRVERREEPRREQPRFERREEPRREQPRVEPRREQPRSTETPGIERRSAPRENRKGDPKDN